MSTLTNLREFCRDNYLDKADSKSERIADRAVKAGLRLLAQCHDWEYYDAVGRINTAEQQSSGTVAVTEDAAVVTLTGGTWPTGLTDMAIRIDSASIDHFFGTRDGANTGTFVSGQVWNDTTVTTGTYVLYQYRYDLATDCRKFLSLDAQSLDWNPNYVSMASFQAIRQSNLGGSGDPTIWSHDNSYIYMWPPPDTKKAIVYQYQRWPTMPSTGGDTIDWTDNLLDVLYGCTALMLDVHRAKMNWLEALVAARALASRMASTEPMAALPDFVAPMYDPDFYGPRNPFNKQDTPDG